jgi:hypothetical protein
MTVARFIMDTARLSVSREGVNVLTAPAQDNIFDSRLAGALGVLLQGSVSIPAVGVTTTVMLPRSINLGTCMANFTISQGIPGPSSGGQALATQRFAAGYSALASGTVFGMRAVWQGILISQTTQYRWIFTLLSDRITVTQERVVNGSPLGAPFAGTIRYTVFQDNIQ